MLFQFGILDWMKLRAFGDYNIYYTQQLKFVSGRVENIVGKVENGDYQHILLFVQCFLKFSFFRLLKVGIV